MIEKIRPRISAFMQNCKRSADEIFISITSVRKTCFSSLVLSQYDYNAAVFL